MMQPIIVAMSLALALSVYWVYDNAECWVEVSAEVCGQKDDSKQPITQAEGKA
jgi:hypothetical protein